MTTHNSDDKYLRREFESIDKGKTGKISTSDFRRSVFDSEPLHGFRSTTIDAYIRQLSNNTDYITFDQFKKFMQAETTTVENPLVILELTEAFKEVDTNRDGYISPQEARRGITLAGERLSGFSFDQLCQQFDDNGDGQMSLEEFLSNIRKRCQK